MSNKKKIKNNCSTSNKQNKIIKTKFSCYNYYMQSKSLSSLGWCFGQNFQYRNSTRKIFFDCQNFLHRNIVPCIQNLLVKFQIDLIYGLRNILDLVKLVNRHFKTKFELNLVRVKHGQQSYDPNSHLPLWSSSKPLTSAFSEETVKMPSMFIII